MRWCTWGINEMEAVYVYVCGGFMSCRLCRYMWGINEM